MFQIGFVFFPVSFVGYVELLKNRLICGTVLNCSVLEKEPVLLTCSFVHLFSAFEMLVFSEIIGVTRALREEDGWCPTN